MLALALLPFASADPCRAGWGEVALALDAAEASWGMSEDGFRAALTDLDARLSCLSEVVAPAAAARVHRVRGLAAFLARDVEAARAAFSAAKAVDPGGAFPVAMVPEGHPVRVLYEAAAPDDRSARLDPPARGAVILDGERSLARPSARPTLFQIEEGGLATTTAWLAPGTAVPDYRLRGEGLRAPLLVGAGVAAAGAGVLYALALDIKTNPPVPTSEEDLQDIGARNHAFVLGSASLGLVAGAGATGAFVWGRW